MREHPHRGGIATEFKGSAGTEGFGGQESGLIDCGSQEFGRNVHHRNDFLIGHPGRTYHPEHPRYLTLHLIGRGDHRDLFEQLVTGFFTDKELNAVGLQAAIEQVENVALVRLEQIYPFHSDRVREILKGYPNCEEVVWCQEEPRNMGAWSFIEPYLEWVLAHIGAEHSRARYAGRAAAASPATGQMSKHLAQLQAFLEEALGD